MKHDYDMIRKIQRDNYESLKKLDEICKKHNISYWVVYGSLIGTIRHDGFIPWDDDLDVGMMWEDFQKLCKVPKVEWGNDCLFVYGVDDDLRHDKLFGRIYQKNTLIQSYTDVEHWENPKTHQSWSTSCMCDIFIYDFIPENKNKHHKIYNRMIRNARNYKLTKLKTVYLEKTVKGYLKRGIKDLYRWFIHVLYKKPWEHYYYQSRRLIEKYPRSNKVCSYYAIDPSVYDYEDIFPLQKHKFEEMEVWIPKNYDKVLKSFYGDYMKFPDEDDRLHIDFVYVKTNDDEEYIIDPIPDSLAEAAKKRLE